MIKYTHLIKNEIEPLKRFVQEHIPRSEKHEDDALSKLVSSADCVMPRTILSEVKSKKSINQEEVMLLSQGKMWMKPIINFKKTGQLPSHLVEAKYVKARDKCFELQDGSLYKKSFDHHLLKCITREDKLEVLKELHEGACASPIGGRPLGENAFKIGLTLKEDAIAYAKKCDSCQKYRNLHQRLSNYPTPILFPPPFAKQGMDILGSFPMAVGQKKFVIVASDYFTKWVEAEVV